MATTRTTVPVKGDTLRRWRGYKTGGARYDEVLNEMMDEIPPESIVKEHLRRLCEEETVSGDSVRSRLKLGAVAEIEIRLTKSAGREFERLDRATQARSAEAIELLRENPADPERGSTFVPGRDPKGCGDCGSATTGGSTSGTLGPSRSPDSPNGPGSTDLPFAPFYP